MSLQDELIELETGFWNATKNPNFYRDHMADDGLAVFSMGLMGKDAAIQSTSGDQATGWTDIRIEEPRILQLTGDVAALVYKGTAKRNGEPYAANSTSVYVRRNGQWQLVLHQQSALAEVPSAR